MSNGEQIGFHQIGLGGVLKQYRLRVPPNQREYSWTEKEVTTLLQDFAKAISDQEQAYFLGTIVTIPRAPDLLEVVDGQQRLATTAILLAQIRNYLQGREALIAESINNGFLTDIDRDRRERVSKLQLNLDDNEFFHSMIASKDGDAPPQPSRDSHRMIAEAFKIAAKQIKNVVAGFDQKDHGDVLNGWLGFIEYRAQVILLKVPSDVNAYKMFETLNDRGLRTSQSDLVKNYLFGQSEGRLEEAQQKWALMRGALETLDEEDITVTFLRHALISVRGYLREGEVYDAVQMQAKGPQASVAFLTMLESLSTVYVAIFNPEHERWNAYPDTMRRAIQTLNLLNIKPMRPLMLAVASRFAPKEAAEAFRSFIAWGVRLLIAGTTRSGSVEVPMATAAKKVSANEISTTKHLRKELATTMPADEQFGQVFEIATVSKASLARYYLRSLEMTVKNETAPWFIPNDDQQVINLEHILPTRPGGNWPHFDDGMVRASVNRLGNQALLLAKQNCDLGSADFSAKKSVYKDAPYELTRQIATVDDWTPERIAARQKRMAELAVRTWPL